MSTRKLVVFFIIALATSMVARSFDFSATVGGTTLYFTILPDGQNVKVVNPNWDLYTQPSGNINLPATVTHEGTTYSITAIDREAFRLCTSLTGFAAPEGLKEIGTLAFMGCSALATIELPTTLDSIANEAFNGTAYYSNSANWTDDGKTLYIGNYLIKVRSNAQHAVSVQEGTLGIAGMAMYYCTHIDSVSLPASLQFIGPMAFADCDTLRKVQLHSATPPRLSSDSFEHVNDLTVFIPCGSTGAYSSTAQWNTLQLVEYGCDTTINDTIPGNTPSPWPWPFPWPKPQPWGIDDASAPSITIATVQDGILVSGAAGKTITVYDATGRIVARQAATDNALFPLPCAGIYLLRTSENRTYKIAYLR